MAVRYQGGQAVQSGSKGTGFDPQTAQRLTTIGKSYEQALQRALSAATDPVVKADLQRALRNLFEANDEVTSAMKHSGF
jgi:spore coat protein CotF